MAKQETKKVEKKEIKENKVEWTANDYIISDETSDARIVEIMNAINKTIPVIMLEDDNGNQKPYVLAKDRESAFRKCYPRGRFDVETLEGGREAGFIRVKAHIYDSKGREISSATACEDKDASIINQKDFIEVAETSALSRALGFLGFGGDAEICDLESYVAAKHFQQTHEIDKKTGEVIEKKHSVGNAKCSQKQMETVLNKYTKKEIEGIMFRRKLNSIYDLNKADASALIQARPSYIENSAMNELKANKQTYLDLKPTDDGKNKK